MENLCHVGVIGAGECKEDIYRLSKDVGFEIGKRGWTLICGGLGGVMEAAALGCSQAGGMTVGILPGLSPEAANPFIRIPIPTGLGEARNLIIVRASQMLIAISGGYGTLSEIALALKTDKPVIGLKTWPNIRGITYAADCADAIHKAVNILAYSAFGGS